jgi:hypothetical protein
MRSPQGCAPVIQFCANCDRDPSGSRTSPVPSTSEAEDTPTLMRRTTRSSSISAESLALSSNHSRSSTPATEVSSALSSPTFAPPLETEESRRRRQQSDAASSEIGKRLLKGWAMLADECPNPRCYGIPLVRPPKTGMSKDPRKVSRLSHFQLASTSICFTPGVRGVRYRLRRRKRRKRLG